VNEGNQSISELIEGLRGKPGFTETPGAKRWLIEIGNPALEPIYEALQTHEDPEVRRRLCHVLGGMREALSESEHIQLDLASIFRSLFLAFSELDPYVAEAARKALGYGYDVGAFHRIPQATRPDYATFLRKHRFAQFPYFLAHAITEAEDDEFTKYAPLLRKIAPPHLSAIFSDVCDDNEETGLSSPEEQDAIWRRLQMCFEIEEEQRPEWNSASVMKALGFDRIPEPLYLTTVEAWGSPRPYRMFSGSKIRSIALIVAISFVTGTIGVLLFYLPFSNRDLGAGLIGALMAMAGLILVFFCLGFGFLAIKETLTLPINGPPQWRDTD